MADPRFLNLTSSGTVTLQGNMVAPCTDANTVGVPGVDANGFEGRLTVLGTVFAHNSTNWPGDSSAYPTTTVVEANTSTNCNVLVLGSIGDVSTNGQWFFDDSALARVGFLNNDYSVAGSGVAQDANSGLADTAFLQNALNQSETEKRAPWPLAATPVGASDVRCFRVFVLNGISANVVIYSDISGLPGLTPP